MIEISLMFLSVCIGLYFLSLGLREFQIFFSNIHFSDLFKRNVDTEGVETPEVEEVRYKYDINAFKKRMEAIKDENGLYDVIPTPRQTDFTGAEVITEQAEIDIDLYARR